MQHSYEMEVLLTLLVKEAGWHKLSPHDLVAEINAEYGGHPPTMKEILVPIVASLQDKKKTPLWYLFSVKNRRAAGCRRSPAWVTVLLNALGSNRGSGNKGKSIETLGDLLRCSKRDLLSIRIIGKKSVEFIEEMLAACSCSLRDSTPF